MERKLFIDSDIQNGFAVNAITHYQGYVRIGDFQYPGAIDKPSWMIDPWYSKYCLWDDRKQSDVYTITDGITKTVTHHPEDCSLTMRLNAANVYEGRPSGDELWPHLLLEQVPFCDYKSLPEEEKRFYCLEKQRTELTINIRMPAFSNTTNPEGINACQFMAYFYLTLIDDPKRFIYFGLNFFDSRGLMDTYWHIDTVGTEMIYLMSTVDTFDSADRSLNCFAPPQSISEWIPIRLDLTPHIDKAISLANIDNIYSRTVSRKDFFWRGTNIGFETHGNIDATIEIRNYNLISHIVD